MGRPRKHVLPGVNARYGRLTVIQDPVPDHGHETVLCRCDCGQVKSVLWTNMWRGTTTSCGCYHRQVTVALLRTHGQSATRLYKIWASMLMRCRNHPDYGLRGIRVCDDWHDWGKFRHWALENGYQPELSIDRIDVNGHYEPANCRWSTQREQTRNRRTTAWITAFGETKSLAEWAEDKRCAVSYPTLSARIGVYGWDTEQAIVTPARQERFVG